MSRYRIFVPVTTSLLNEVSSGVVSQSATQVVISNTDGTFTIFNGTGLSIVGGVGQPGGVVTSIQHSTAASGGTILEQFDQLVTANNDFASYINLTGAALFNYATSQNDDGFGSTGVDVITLGAALTTTGSSNNYTGFQGNDTFIGGAGFDFLSYATEMNTTYPGTANPITPGTQGVIVNMTAGTLNNITVTGGTFSNILSNTAKDSYGNTDTFSSMEGASGTSFNDAIYGNASDNTFRGYAGNDFIDGGAGFDELSAYGSGTTSGIFFPSTGMTVTYTAGTSFDGTASADGFGGVETFVSIERIRGTQLVDTFNGNDANNSYRGLAGNDVMNGGAGFDEANYGQDISYGATQGVIVNLSGSTLNGVTVTGGTFNGIASNTAKDGFGNTDTLNSIENAVGTNNNDYMSGSAWDNQLNGGGGSDTLIGNDGFDFFTPGGGTDTVNGSPLLHPDQSYDDRDRVSYNDNNNGVGVAVNLTNATINGITVGGVVGTVNVAATSARDWNGNTDTLIDIERVRGTMSADYFHGSDTANLRDERFQGLGGADIINGGNGTDYVEYNADAQNGGTAGVTVNLALGTATDGFGATDTLISIESAVGTDNSDIFVGDGGRNTFRVLGGNDTVDGGGGLFDQVDMYIGDIFGGAGATVNLTTHLATGIAGGISALTNIEDIAGSEGDDNFTGDANDNSIGGSAGNDTLNGLAGDDLLNGGPGNNIIDGGDGEDILSYMYDPALGQYFGLHYASFFPTPWTGVTVNLATHTATNFAGGTDTITNVEDVVGTFLADNITGDAGNNAFDGLGGDDVIDGGGGIDTIYYGRYDSNGRTETLLPGINGSDPNGVTVNIATHTANDGEGGTDTLTNIENVIGSKGSDTITGDGADNRIDGGAGADVLDGGAGSNDTAGYEDSSAGVTVFIDNSGGSGVGGDAQGDQLFNFENLRGSFNNDALNGDGNGNRLEGLAGDDILDGFGGADTMIGGDGNDTYYVDNVGDVVTEEFGLGSDIVNTSLATYVLGANLESLSAIGAAASFILIGNELNNFIYDALGARDSIMNGAAGDDGISGFGGNDAMYGDAGHDTLFGDDGNDTLVGNALANPFAQESDILNGGNGTDTIYGEFTDTIDGGADTDTLVAENAFDWSINLGSVSIEVMLAGFGNDTINASTQTAGVTVFASGGTDVVTGSNQADFLWGGVGGDTLNGGGGNDVIVGEDGADSMSGGEGDDQIYTDGGDSLIDGGNGTDVLYIGSGSGISLNLATTNFEWVIDSAGGNDTLNGASMSANMVAFAGGGTDVITGGAGADFLWGEAGNDTIVGGANGDTLVGGSGIDSLNGGAGIDTLFMSTGGGGDTSVDTAVYNAAGWGTDFIYDFEHLTDKINMQGSGATIGTLSITNVSGHAYVSFGGADLIVVVNQGATLTSADFTF